MLENSQFNPNHHIKTAINTEAPVTSGGTPAAPETPQNPNRKRNRNLIIGGVSVLATGALALTLGFGLNSGNKSQGERPPEGTKTSAPANPGETNNEKGNNVTPEYQFTPDLINIPAGLSDKEYATRLLDDLTKWHMAGANDATYSKWQDAGYSDSIRSEIAAENLQVVQGSHLYSEAGLSDPTIQESMQNDALINAGAVQGWLATYNKPGTKPTAGQIEAFNVSLSLDSVTTVKTSDGGRELIIDGTQHNNADKNTVGSQEDVLKQDGLKFEFHITTSVADGFEQIDTLTAK